MPACVYGDFSRALAERVGRRGRLEVSDVARIQAANCRGKLRHVPQATVRLANAGILAPLLLGVEFVRQRRL